MKISIISLGSRGDIEPVIALSKEFMNQGYIINLISNTDAKKLANTYKVPFNVVSISARNVLVSQIGQDLMKSASPTKSAKIMAKLIIDKLAEIAPVIYEYCKNSDLIIANERIFLLADAIAEKIGIPHIQLCFQPKGMTKVYPYPYVTSKIIRMFGNKNSHLIVEHLLLKYFLRYVNPIREFILKLPTISLKEAKHRKRKISSIQGFSPSLFPPPLDWSVNKWVTGYWILKQNSTYKPDSDLVAFLEEDVAPVYVGFGSMLYDPLKFLDMLLQVQQLRPTRFVFSPGWAETSSLKEGRYSDSIYIINETSHDLLFPKVAGVIHHGGAGTIKTSLTCGTPTMVAWFMLDQSFWAQRIDTLGLGKNLGCFSKLTVKKLISAVDMIYENKELKRNTKIMAKKLQSENGVYNAVHAVSAYLENIDL